jgi:hypothetical protein
MSSDDMMIELPYGNKTLVHGLAISNHAKFKHVHASLYVHLT